MKYEVELADKVILKYQTDEETPTVTLLEALCYEDKCSEEEAKVLIEKFVTSEYQDKITIIIEDLVKLQCKNEDGLLVIESGSFREDMDEEEAVDIVNKLLSLMDKAPENSNNEE